MARHRPRRNQRREARAVKQGVLLPSLERAGLDELQEAYDDAVDDADVDPEYLAELELELFRRQ